MRHGAGISIVFSKTTKGAPGLTTPSDGRMTVNNACAFTSLRMDLGFNSNMFGTEISD